MIFFILVSTVCWIMYQYLDDKLDFDHSCASAQLVHDFKNAWVVTVKKVIIKLTMVNS